MAGKHVDTQEMEATRRKNILNDFTQLSNDKAQLRMQSASNIIENALSKKGEADGELKYTITRLVRGMGASKRASQMGYFATFSVLLECLPPDKFPLDSVVSIVEEELHTSRQNSKSENADILSGIVLASGAILGSGKFSSLSAQNQKTVVEQLKLAGSKRSYLGLLAAEVLVDPLQNFDETCFKKDLLPLLQPYLKQPLEKFTLDSLYLLLQLQARFPKVITSKFLKKTIGRALVLESANHQVIVKTLMHVQPGWHADKHPIYALLATAVANLADDVFAGFLRHLDDDLATPSPTKHLVHAAFLRHILSALVDGNRATLCLGEHFLQASIAHFKRVSSNRKSEPLIAALRAVFGSLVQCALRPETSTESHLGLIRRLLVDGGSFLFEKITGTKLIQQLTGALRVCGVRQLSALYMDVVRAATGTHANAERVYAAQLMGKLLAHPALRDSAEDAWKLEQLRLLLQLGCMRQPNVSAELAKSISDTFLRAMDPRLNKLALLRVRLTHLVGFVDERKEQLRTPLTEAQSALWTKTMRRISKLESSEQSLSTLFHTLFAYMQLQLLANVALAEDALRELHDCYKRMLQRTDDDKPPWQQVVVDLFLHLLSHSSSALRSLIGCVFPHLCPDLTHDALDQILHVLEPGIENPLLEMEESDEEEQSDEGESDVDETQLDQLRQALQGVLVNGESDMESVDLDELSDGEAEQLDTALGAAFACFRPQRGGGASKQQPQTEAALMHFRVRVMDLIDIYIASEPPMETCVRLLLPLLAVLEFAVRDAHQEPLKARVESALAKLAAARHFQARSDTYQPLSMASLVDTMEQILSKGEKSALMMPDLGQAISDCCMLVIHISSSLTRSRLAAAPLVDVIMAKLEEFIGKRDCLTPFAVFKRVMDSSWEHKGEFVAPLLKVVFNGGVRRFRRRQALDLLQLFYANRRALAANAAVYAEALASSEDEFLADVNRFLEKQDYSDISMLPDVFRLLAAMKRAMVVTSKSADGWSAMKGLLPGYRAGVILNNNAKKAYNKLCGALGIPQFVKMKSTAVRPGREDEDENGDAGKRKKTNPAKMKKEARNIRMESLSEGIAQISFANSKLLQLNEDAMQDDEQLVPSAAVNGDAKGKLNDKNKKRKMTSGNHLRNRQSPSKAINGDKQESIPKKKTKK